jgi:hypothetical protein
MDGASKTSCTTCTRSDGKHKGGQGSSHVVSEFDLQQAITETMELQARRTMRSLSESSCSSLSSCASACSASSLTCVASCGEDGAGGVRWEGRTKDEPGSLPRTEGREGEASCSLGKRRRKRNPEKEGERAAKRQRANPRKRGRPRKERIGRSKRRQATGQALESHVSFKSLRPSLNVEESLGVFGIEYVKAQGVAVVSWDGV